MNTADPVPSISRLPVPAHANGNAVVTPMDMLGRAVESGAGLDVLTKLMDLQERWEKNQARKAFDEAMAAAKAEMPVILKNREVDFTSQKGRTNYRYEDLAEIARTVDPILARHGLAYRYRTTSLPNEPITVTCIVSHRDGHFEENTLSGGRDESGNKNALQAIGSAITFLQRYALKAALGLAASTDDDGRSSGNGNGLISDEQRERLMDTIAHVGADLPRFLRYFKLDILEDMPARRFDEAIGMLNRKVKS